MRLFVSTFWPRRGLVPAATSSLPERADRHRDYDYRYVWIRDQCYAGIAAAAAGPLRVLTDSVRFVTERLLSDGDRLAPVYRVDGGPVPDQRTLALAGYPGGTDVVGNHANAQFQLDSLGECLTLFAAAAEHDVLDDAGWRAAMVAVDVAAQRWDRAEAGIWELEDRWWTHSRLALVAGLRRMGAAGPPGRAGQLDELAAAVLRECDRRCRNDRGFWQRSPHDPRVDAALVLPPVRGALPASDPRTCATLAQVKRTLSDDGYVYRYSTADGQPLGDAEGAFLLCGFQVALADLHQGRVTEAFRRFERNRAACGPPGLFSEEYDVQQRQLRGNLPQAFVHALMFETSTRLASAT